MKPRDFYYSVIPIKKEVTREEFNEFLKNYPRSLEVDVCGIYEPPCISYNDFELADRWPYSVVAKTWAYSYIIMVNYKEVFDSRTGNKTKD